MAVENQDVRLDVNVTVTWKSGMMYFPSLIMMEKEIIQSWYRKILIPVWDLSVLPVRCRMWIPCSTLIR